MASFAVAPSLSQESPAQEGPGLSALIGPALAPRLLANRLAPVPLASDWSGLTGPSRDFVASSLWADLVDLSLGSIRANWEELASGMSELNGQHLAAPTPEVAVAAPLANISGVALNRAAAQDDAEIAQKPIFQRKVVQLELPFEANQSGVVIAFPSRANAVASEGRNPFVELKAPPVAVAA